MKLIKNKIQEILEKQVPNGKHALMVLAEELDKTNKQISTLKKRLKKNER